MITIRPAYRASSLAYDLNGMLRVAMLAAENETSGANLVEALAALSRVMAVAERVTCELIDLIEELESGRAAA